MSKIIVDSCVVFTMDSKYLSGRVLFILTISSGLISFVSFGGFVASSLLYFSLSFFDRLQLSHLFLFAPENALEINQTISS
ncbi:hypothetical protein Peur_008450 [Populus x canadensis]